MSSSFDRTSDVLWCTDKLYYNLPSLYFVFFANICLCCQWLTVAPHYSFALYHASKDTVVSLLPQSHLDACRYSLCQVMLAASFVSRESSSSSPQPRYGIHNYSQRPSLANAFPPPGVSTYSRHCDALEDTVEKLYWDKKTPVNLSCPMDWSSHVGKPATLYLPYDYCSS